MSLTTLTGSWPTFEPREPHAHPRRTKIVCTLGPATTEAVQILAIAQAGMDCARLNFSHGTHDEHGARIAAVREAERTLGRPISLLADLCGPKIRIARDMAPRVVEPGDIVVFCGTPGQEGDIVVTFPGLAEAVAPEESLLVEDGKIRTRAIDRDGDRVRCVVETPGAILPGKGVNIPQTAISIPCLTDKDLADLEFALGQGVDHVALSFVQRAEDVAHLRSLIAAAGSPARIVSKIEKADAVANLDAIVTASDVVMVARGDLGVEIGVEEVPLVQKRIIARAAAIGRTVITATQMLESMIESPAPTRAEASDVANAILDGTSAVMLSAETASGRYPVRAVETMDRIARSVEPSLAPRVAEPADDVAEILTSAACAVAAHAGADAIAVHTETGATAREVSRGRPMRPILAATTSEVTWHQLALEWGVIPTLIEPADRLEDVWTAILRDLVQRDLAAPGDTVVLTGRATLPVPGPTSSVVLHRLEPDGEAR